MGVGIYLNYIKNFFRIYLGLCNHQYSTLDCYELDNKVFLLNRCVKCGKEKRIDIAKQINKINK